MDRDDPANALAQLAFTRNRALRTNRKDLAIGMAAYELAALALSDDDARWQDALGRIERIRPQLRAPIDEVARVVVLAGERADAGGRPARAREAWPIAAAIYEALEDDVRLAELRAAMRRLG